LRVGSSDTVSRQDLFAQLLKIEIRKSHGAPFLRGGSCSPLGLSNSTGNVEPGTKLLGVPSEKGLEFAAEMVSPYDASMLDRPQLGQFLLIELGSQEEAALGRITRFVRAGLLAGPEGEDYVNTMQRRQTPVPEDLKRQRLKYRVQVKLLGAVRVENGKVVYVPSQRRLPHLGARVALPSGAVLQELCRLSRGTTDLGDYVLGEFVYGGGGVVLDDLTFRPLDPKLVVTFDVRRLVSRRSVVFARAGYGKSNLMKYLLAELYREAPKTDSGIDVGTLMPWLPRGADTERR